ncbi:hypothetical protein BDL97_04G022700 [Sphagnum fallax]|nr:hypothetical protein BDL97_04G022700 [Sphagnum fallax]
MASVELMNASARLTWCSSPPPPPPSCSFLFSHRISATTTPWLRNAAISSSRQVPCGFCWSRNVAALLQEKTRRTNRTSSRLLNSLLSCGGGEEAGAARSAQLAASGVRIDEQVRLDNGGERQVETRGKVAAGGFSSRHGVEITLFFKGFLNLALSLAVCVNNLGQAPSSIAANLPNAAAVQEISWEENAELPPIPSSFPPLPDVTLPAYEKMVLQNGLRVFLLEDHELGLVGGQLIVRGGGKTEPPSKVGLAAIAATVQRSGGSIAHPADVLNTKLEAMAARVEASSSVSSMNVAFRCLAEDLPAVFPLFSEVVQEPLMPEDKLELVRSQLLGAIARRGDDAGSIVGREFPKLLYGNESVYARVSEAETVKNVQRSDLLAFHKQVFHPDAGVLGIWGDFDSSAVKVMLRQYFGDWQTSLSSELTGKNGILMVANGRPALETGISASGPNIYVVDRPGLSQGYVRMGELGTTLADPDVCALDVLNGILNGFGGLLFDEVRSREGLAYSVSGGWAPAVEHRGAFVAGGETQLKSVVQFVQAVKGVLHKVTQEPPSIELLNRAKDAALNSFIFNFTDSGVQLGRVLAYELFDIDQDFIFKYKKLVEQTTANDVLKAAQVHLHPESQTVLIVTDVQKVQPLLAASGIPVVQLRPSYLNGR